MADAMLPGERYRKRLAALKQGFSSWLTHLREVAENMLPRASRFLVSDATTAGSKKNERVNNGVATDALERGAAALHSTLTSPAQRWLAITTASVALMAIQTVKVWCTEVEDRMYEIFDRSNLYKVLPDFYEQLLAFGTAVIFCEEDAQRIVHFYVFPIGSYYVALNGKLEPDTLYRETSMSVGQIVEKFCRKDPTAEPDFGNCSPRIKDCWVKGEYDEMIEVCHGIEPNREAKPGRADNANMPWRSFWFETAADKKLILGSGGFNVFPCAIGRWKVTGGDAYGNSPGMKALPDVKSLQILEDRILQALDQQIEPPLQIPAGANDGRPLERQPGGENFLTTTGTGARIEPLNVVLPGAMEQAARQRAVYEQRIERAFFADLVLNLTGTADQPQKTAEEIRARKQEILLQLGSPVGGINRDVLRPIVENVFDMMSRVPGALPPIPEEMAGAPLKVEFRSLVAQAQKAAGVSGLIGYSQFVLGHAEADQASLDVVDFDKLNEHGAEFFGVPPDVVRGPDERQALRDARAQAQEQAALMASAKPLADAAGAVQKLGATRAVPGSVLKNLGDAAGEQAAA